ncbi:uncharacterized protein TNCV_2114851 [Trichonephila clavipes]|nr:uncharacterized protein TNCV_2114851 [Trichonephila clavipes]
MPEPEFHGSIGNRIINFQALMGIISILCCPECYATGLKLAEDSKEGLCSNLRVACNCGAHELKLLEAVQLRSEENMKAASKEVQNFKKSTTCGVLVDGTWQRRGHMSLNGCVSVISIDTGKFFRSGRSSGNMEAVGAFRIFERSLIKRDLQCIEYYGDGDSKGFLQVKDIYGENSVTKLE